MRKRHGRGTRLVAAVVTGLLVSAGLTVAEIAPASAVVPDQPVSAVASSMWQTNNTVWALEASNGVVYAGGDFTSVRPPGAALGSSEVARNHLAAFSASTGALLTSFNPNVNGRVLDLDVSPDGSKLYVAGSFTTVGSSTRQRIARLNLPSGSVDTQWTANANATVATVSAGSNAVYVGGDFTIIKNVNRTRLARLSATSGNVSATFTASSDKRITESAIAPDGSRVLVGGENDVINGQPQAAIASLDPTTGALRPWAATGIAPRMANGGCDANLTDIVVSGSTAYVTAEAPRPGCWEGVYAANISDGALIFNEWCLGGSTSLAVAQGWLYRGSHNHDCTKNAGGFTGPNNPDLFVWYRLEVHSLTDGRQGHWSPNTNGGSPGTSTTVGPQVMATDGNQIFVGGDQSQVNGQNQQGLARFSPDGPNSAPQTPVAPTVTATAAGRLTIVANGVADNNDGVLTYRLYRDGGNTPIATHTAESWPWSRPILRFEDSGLAAGSSHTYQLQANDGTTNGSRSPASAPVTVSGTAPAAYATRLLAAAPMSYWRLHTSGPLMADSSNHSRQGRIEGGVTRLQPGALAGNNGHRHRRVFGLRPVERRVHADGVVQRVRVVQDHHGPRWRHHGLVERGDGCGYRQQPRHLDGQRREGRLRDPDPAAGARPAGQLRPQCRHLQRREVAPGRRDVRRDEHLAVPRRGTGRELHPGRRRGARGSGAGLHPGRVPGPHQPLHGLRLELRREAGAAQLLLRRQPGRGRGPFHRPHPAQVSGLWQSGAAVLAP